MFGAPSVGRLVGSWDVAVLLVVVKTLKCVVVALTVVVACEELSTGPIFSHIFSLD